MVLAALRRLKYVYGAPPLDNFIFKLCYRWTASMLVLFSCVITCRLLLGDSFVCTFTEDNLNQAYLSTKCYNSAVYTSHVKSVIDATGSTSLDPPVEDFKRYQSHYSWVNLLFLVHAFMFYLPHLLWKSYERDYMYRLTAGVQKFFDREERRGLELCYLAKYVLVTQGKHRLYTGMYVFFEACNCAIALAQTLSLIHFFDVTGVPNFKPHVLLETWSDFRNFYFPSEGLCEVQAFVAQRDVASLAATVQTSMLPRDITVTCQLPLNRLYMLIFLFLQAWYIALIVACGLVLVYRVALVVPTFRILAVKLSSPLSEKSVLASVCCRLSYGDWFFLSRLQKAMTDIDFAQMVDKISIVSQSRDSQRDDDDARFSMYEDVTKDFDSFTASPV